MAKAKDYGICCTSCQEPLNIHPCTICGKGFDDGDEIECEHHSQTDCLHHHKSCEDDKTKGT